MGQPAGDLRLAHEPLPQLGRHQGLGPRNF